MRELPGVAYEETGRIVWNYGPAGTDRRNNLVVNYLWSVPRGRSGMSFTEQDFEVRRRESICCCRAIAA